MIANFTFQTWRMGVYVKIAGVTKNDRSVYLKNDNSNYLWKGKWGWYVGTNYTIDMIALKNSASVSEVVILS